jgi:hypothetical protein
MKAEDMPFPTLQRQIVVSGLNLAFSYCRQSFSQAVRNDVETALETNFACRAIDHGKQLIPVYKRCKLFWSPRLPPRSSVQVQHPRTPDEQDQSSRVKTPIKAEKADKSILLNFGVLYFKPAMFIF